VKREEHPVWAVYNGLRKARLNVKYYCHLLSWEERKTHWLEIILAITAPTSAFTGLILFKSDTGKIVWQCIAAVSGLAAVSRPWMTKRIKEYEATISAYRALESDFEMIRQNVQLRGQYDGEQQKKFLAALERARHANDAAPKTSEKRELVRKYTAEVNDELPPEDFFVPTNQEELRKPRANVTGARIGTSGDERKADAGELAVRTDGSKPSGATHVLPPAGPARDKDDDG
jgi:hypothetical protein